jgi:hypothetical protein
MHLLLLLALFLLPLTVTAQPKVSYQKGRLVESQLVVQHGFRDGKKTEIPLPKGRWSVRYVGETKSTQGDQGVNIWLEESVSGKVSQFLTFQIYETNGKNWQVGTSCDFLLSSPRGSTLSGGCFGLSGAPILNHPTNTIQTVVREEYVRESISIEKEALWLKGIADRRDGLAIYFNYAFPFLDSTKSHGRDFLARVRSGGTLPSSEAQLANWFRTYGQSIVDGVVGTSPNIQASILMRSVPELVRAATEPDTSIVQAQTTNTQPATPQVQTAEVEAERKKQQELEQQEASIKERDRITAELDAERRKRQELQAELDRAKELAESRLTERPLPQAVHRSERRVALVIGNAQYKLSPLENSVNDATDIDQALKRFGFQTTFLRNASLGQIREATRRFADQLTNADVALIYFAGHGIESKNKNYMIPVNADLKFEYELADQAYDAAAWLEMLEMIKSNNAERVNIVILDACRNNNLIGSRSLNRGLGRMDAPTGTFLSYSTAPGKVAADGGKGERNSPFTKNLLKAIQQPGQPIEEVFKEVRRNVTRETNGAQVPWESTSLTGFFSFRQAR